MPAKTNADSEYWFDEDAARAAVDFFPRHLVFTKGEWAGRPFMLADWEIGDIVRPAFGWKRRDGTRRYRRVAVWIPRKNGKSELAAGMGHILLLGDGEPGAEVYSIATNKDQASIVFNLASQMLAGSPTLGEHLEAFKDSIFCPELQAVFRPLAGLPKGRHGLNMSGMIGDELHEWENDRLYQFVHQSSAARRQPLEFLISSAGEMTGFGWEFYQYCEAVLAGDVEDPGLLVVIYQADAERDRRDPNYWKTEEAARAANPNYGISPKAEYLAEERRKAERLPRLENDYKRYHLGLWVEQAARWLPMDAWHDCGQAPALRPELRAAAEEDRPVADDTARQMMAPDKNRRWRDLAGKMKGREAYAGIDLASTTDLAAFVLTFAPEQAGGLWTIVPRFYCPEVSIKLRSKRDKVPYEHWSQTGALIATPGNVIDYAFIRRDVMAACESHRVKKIAIDRWNATQMSTELIAEGLDVEGYGQGFVSMSAPSKQFEALILSRQVDHGGHPVLAFNARSVAVEMDAAENIKPSKKHSRERIDGIVAALMAMGVAMAAPKAPDLNDFLMNPVHT